MKANDTASQLMDAAQDLIQDRGYNAFSYKDLAETVGIRTASIHYHFPSKGDLGVALMQRYLEDLDEALAKIDRNARSARAKLKALFRLYAETEAGGAICLCGSLAADRQTLPEPLQDAVAAYLERSEAWVAEVLSEGKREGEFRSSTKPDDTAVTLLASLQGGLILSRARSEREPLLASVQRVLLKNLETPS